MTACPGFVGFCIALSALPISGAVAATSSGNTTDSTSDRPPPIAQPIESRLARLTTAIRQRESLLPQTATPPIEEFIAGGFVNHSGGGFVNSLSWGNGGWINGGDFLNSRPWMNGGWMNGGFRNGGGFLNYF